MTNILVTGGAGYIASHTNIELVKAGFTPIIVDNFSNSSKAAVERSSKLAGQALVCYEGDVRNRTLMEKIFSENDIAAVIHFAGLKAVGESTEKPLDYYDCNISSTLTLLETMQRHNCKHIVFSSSATVYGDPAALPLDETSPAGVGLTNPYGKTKYFIEEILRDLAAADETWRVTILRYFNPIGAHPSGTIGEDPAGIPNNLLPFVTQVAVGKRDELNVFGDDYDTVDGTGVRDYIHVVDLAKGHLCAVKYVMENKGVEAVNLGTGKGSSVYDVLHSFEKACGKKLPYVVKPRRAGDIATCYADTAKAKKVFGWEAQYGLDEMTADSWNFIKNNPNGL